MKVKKPVDYQLAHIYLKCEDCGKEFIPEDNKLMAYAEKAMRQAGNHAGKYKHLVLGEISFGMTIDGKDK